MSTLADADPTTLRPLLHAQIDRLTDQELEAIRLALLELEAKKLREEVREGAEQDRQAGMLDPAKVDQAVREHRAKHPYR